MKVYVYKAALLCEDCGEATRFDLASQGKAPADPSDESRYDSDDFPKGPYPNGGGEADHPQHCDGCNLFLENPLTDEGDSWVREAAGEFIDPDSDESWEEVAQRAEDGGAPVLAEWIRFYFAPGM